ncbi:hypothetical protein LCGC14_3136870, partial [marine sediment metagenome]
EDDVEIEVKPAFGVKIKAEDIPQDLIEYKRIQIQLNRKIKNKRNESKRKHSEAINVSHLSNT